MLALIYMHMLDLLFYIISFFLVLSSLTVVLNRNPVHSVLALIFAFFNASAIFLMLGAEFVAMTLVIVYVGAVAVLFLFVVMMLNINVAELKQGFTKSLPLGILMGAVILFELYFTIDSSQSFFPQLNSVSEPGGINLTNTEMLGMLLYTDYFISFQTAGIILLVAMIGAIVLTLHHDKDMKRQSIHKQVLRSRDESVELIDVKVGEGVKL